MSFSYSGDPSNSLVDRCRFELGDTSEDNYIMQDEEIEFLIDKANGSMNMLLYSLFTQAAVIYAKDIKRSLGPQSEDPSGRVSFFKEKATEYRTKMASAGISLPTYAHPKIFSIGMQNNPPWRPENV